MTDRWDESWRQLLNWTNGQGRSERLAGQIVLAEGYENLDPSHPLGGPDGGKDAVCRKDGLKWLVAVHFPRGRKPFSATKKKFLKDLGGVKSNDADGLVFVTNQELALAQRAELKDASAGLPLEIYHLERVTAIVDQPGMASVRKQFLGLDPDQRLERALPNFSGEIGHGPNAIAFDSFVWGNMHKVVHLDVFQPAESFDGESVDHFIHKSFILWNETPAVGPPANPFIFKPGTQYIVDHNPDIPESTLMCVRSTCRLRGYFVIVAGSGPHMGLMSIRMRPVKAEDALRTR